MLKMCSSITSKDTVLTLNDNILPRMKENKSFGSIFSSDLLLLSI